MGSHEVCIARRVLRERDPAAVKSCKRISLWSSVPCRAVTSLYDKYVPLSLDLDTASCATRLRTLKWVWLIRHPWPLVLYWKSWIGRALANQRGKDGWDQAYPESDDLERPILGCLLFFYPTLFLTRLTRCRLVREKRVFWFPYWPWDPLMAYVMMVRGVSLPTCACKVLLRTASAWALISNTPDLTYDILKCNHQRKFSKHMHWLPTHTRVA